MYVCDVEHQLNTRRLVEVGIISYTLACLSSLSADVRAAARFILCEFRPHLQSSVYSESIQVGYIPIPHFYTCSLIPVISIHTDFVVVIYIGSAAREFT